MVTIISVREKPDSAIVGVALLNAEHHEVQRQPDRSD